MSAYSTQQSDEPVAPWYRQGWFWFVFGIPMASVCLGTTMLIVAFTNQDSLVKDEYYKSGKAINQVIARNQRAETLQIGADLKVDQLTGEVSLQLRSRGEQLPPSLRLSFLSPTQAKQDQIIDVKQVSAGRYTGQLERELSGRRYLHLETIEDQVSYKPSEEGWLIEGQHNFDGNTDIQIGYTGP
ncbi:FixH family protein [Aestuariirhabdus sp. Z084]|uniref:FixH family protein n=1 Tax=Aestuariirhabdus haliotis TaxID=2918751 RepID=UPI00201B408B|nr:FixH family protein [Aestuariirhabdus haliotis]MCL6415767.1 FixH family protein [Aestuariirhabdus haliotis]MCL6419684.1 FixH family protein [Aestuariirhabdus haliotis]